MIKYYFIVTVFVLCFNNTNAQQYPWWTQYRNNPMALNPGFTGTKRLLDARLSYRNQWTGFEGAPKTYVLALNSRFMKGQLGAGGFLFKDDIGPFRTLSGSVNAAYHLKFPDSEISFGFQGNYIQQQLVGTDIRLRNQQDKAINQYLTDKSSSYDGSFGIVYYNDRFHLGIAANNIAGSSIEFYKNDTLKKGIYKNVGHYNVSAGYNWADDPNFIFENSVLAVYVPGMPFAFDYTLRLHMMQQLMAGMSIRFGDALALQIGYTIKNEIHIAYSYDIVTSPLRRYQNGTHEIKMVFSSNLGTDKKKRGLDKRFIRQKYQYLL